MEYKTTDTALAAYLITQGFTPASIDYSNPPRYFILFNHGNSSLQEYATKYVSGTARVDPATYYRVSRKLNRVLRNLRQWEED